MNILVVGSGGREHALIWKIESPKVKHIYAAPGNAGIASLAECVPVPEDEIKKLASFALSKSIDLTLVGPELLTLGIVDGFKRYGLKICGPDRTAARIEGSKLFAKELMKKYRVPTADYAAFESPSEAAAYIRGKGIPAVIKADGLAAGKGVMPVHSLEEAEKAIETILTRKEFGAAGSRIVIEDFLRGEEASFIAFTDGKTILPMPSTQDHKAIYDGDKGPNTGGMGAYSPAPVITEKLARRIMDEVMTPVVKGMAAEGSPFKGILYAGMMIEGHAIRVLEFNARSGDPETRHGADPTDARGSGARPPPADAAGPIRRPPETPRCTRSTHQPHSAAPSAGWKPSSWPTSTLRRDPRPHLATPPPEQQVRFLAGRW